jgi:hypothetical protein
MKQLQQTLDLNHYISCIKVESKEFYDFGKFKYKIYMQTPLTGHTKYQYFYLEDTDMGILYRKHANQSTNSVHQKDLKKGRPADRKAIINEFDMDKDYLEQLDVPGVK